MKKTYKSLLSTMLKQEPSGLTYTKILANFRKNFPQQCRKNYIRLALSKKPFRLLRKKYTLVKKETKKKSKATVARKLKVGPKATIFDNSSVGIVPTLTLQIHSVPQWQYEHDDWKNYDKTANDVVEAAYQEWQKNKFTDVRAIKSGEWQYTVDFNTMLQQNIQHENHTRRSIRRTLVSL